jgi:hypothetical protein
MYMSYRAVAVHRPNRCKITIDQYIHYQRNGYLIVQGLVEEEAVQKLNIWSDDILYGRAALSGMGMDDGNMMPVDEGVQTRSNV